MARIGSAQGRRRRRGDAPRLPLGALLGTAMVALCVIWLAGTYAIVTSQPSSPSAAKERRAQKKKAAGVVGKKKKKNPRKGVPKGDGKSGTESIVDMLVDLARMPGEELRRTLDGGEDPFRLDELQKGECPFDGASEIDWLPDRPALSERASGWLKDRAGEPFVMVYYEHLSKAGGTSFCKLAQSNMKKREVPRYYCMPSDENSPDARVGSWPAEKLRDYARRNEFRLVSNEWEPFNLGFMEEFQPTDPDAKLGEDDVVLFFVTSIRNPINRLLSAHRFWGHLHNNAKVKPTLEQWLGRYARRAKTWKIKSPDITANVARFNFATWKFSGGSLPVYERQLQSERFLANVEPGAGVGGGGSEYAAEDDESFWREHFETAVRTLARFDLAIPMEFLSAHPEPVRDAIGWKNFDDSHVVPSGKILNNQASSELPPEEYARLWDANKLDMVLYYWTCAVYLARLHCS